MPPDAAIPGPCFDYLGEIVRWLDHQFKDRNTGVAEEPPIQVYMQRYDAPCPDRLLTGGEWRGEMTWPPTGTHERTWFLEADGCLDEVGYPTSTATGSNRCNGGWCEPPGRMSSYC